jgi:hypothetical protein
MAQITYLDFDLLIDRFGKKHKGRVINSPAEQAATEFDAPFSAGELREFWSKLETCLQKKEASPADCKPTIKKFGGRLFETAFARRSLGVGSKGSEAPIKPRSSCCTLSEVIRGSLRCGFP